MTNKVITKTLIRREEEQVSEAMIQTRWEGKKHGKNEKQEIM